MAYQDVRTRRVKAWQVLLSFALSFAQFVAHPSLTAVLFALALAPITFGASWADAVVVLGWVLALPSSAFSALGALALALFLPRGPFLFYFLVMLIPALSGF